MLKNIENREIFEEIKSSKEFFEEKLGIVLTPRNDNICKNHYPEFEKTSRDDIGDFAFNDVVICFYPVWNEKQGFEIKKINGHHEEVLYIIQTSHTQKSWEEIILQEENLKEIKQILGL